MTNNGWQKVVLLMVSGGLFGFGASTLGLTFWPLLVRGLPGDEPEPFFGSLPIAPERAEVFWDADAVPPKTPYPPWRSDLGEVAEGNWIRIPTINVNVPLASSASMNDEDVLAVLDEGAALYPNGILPGRLGNTFISAHSTGQPWKGKYRFAFLDIDQLTAGNLIHLDYQGARYTYRIAEKKIVEPTPDFKVESGRPVPTLTLMACWPLWSTTQRMLVTAELTNITRLDL